VPLSDRDYMKNPPPSRRRTWRPADYGAAALNPVLVLIVINLVFYIAALVTTQGRYPFGEHSYINTDKISYYMALIPYYFTSRPWMLISAMFIHEGFWHLFGNMITLYFFGTFLVRFIGNNWFLLLYIIGGIVGNALYLWLGEPLSIALGASGAVYAVAGALVVMMPKLPVRLYFVLPVPLWVVVLVFFGIWSIPGVAASNIAWQAHLGGLAVGLIAGFFFRRRIRLNFYR
jgi:membrane associated rhomboid family serine protease